MKMLQLMLFSTLALTACRPSSINSVSLTSQPLYAASLNDNGTQALLSTAKGISLQSQLLSRTVASSLSAPKAAALNVSISANGQYGAGISRNNITLWQLDDRRMVEQWILPARSQTLSLANNGSLLTGLPDGQVLFITPGQKAFRTFNRHSDSISAVALSPDGRLALSGSQDGQVWLWQTDTSQALHTWQLGSRISRLAISNNAHFSFAANSMNTALIIDNRSGHTISQLHIPVRQQIFSCARFIDDGARLLTGTPSREIILWHSQNGKKVASWQAKVTKRGQINSAVVYSVAKSAPDRVISISSNGLLETWPLPSAKR
ncbi:hypothetical protein NFHSH190041_09200 [Shewanella sp. NFH-SH190041]|uniref:WD40 repeat domain-containing protein n=1 Tax=Shewanella sp. NFH-SH190041 TaxID=2950245 RepID=UPI0021C2F119|nr:hypothetical protein [Shewanella sp. NFH-SH190041]BDM63468.1 hypothetical protein NFHSH190041_09200 [Shewanella sp. NFH-SH190041]